MGVYVCVSVRVCVCVGVCVRDLSKNIFAFALIDVGPFVIA